jgi:vitamin B12 transporter
VPLELIGYASGFANVPVNLIDRVEVYSGVVPVRFGADALGGAVNLVTDPALPGTHAGLSYELGSLGTDRLTGSVRVRDHGVYARADGYFDHATNDYPVDVTVADLTTGKLTPVTTDQFHDRYVAGGGSIEAGVVDQPWAKRLAVRGFANDFAQQYQSNETMGRVYGGVSYAQASGGGSVLYADSFAHDVSVDAVAGYAYTRGHYLDRSRCIFDWLGHCVGMNKPGEVDDSPHDQVSNEHGVFARANARWKIAPGHELRLAVAPTFDTRTGHERETASGSIDPLAGTRELISLVNGLEYQLDGWGDRLENVAFVKQYYQRQAAEDPEPGVGFEHFDRHTVKFGGGDGVRVRFADSVYAKASYEYATRLPSAVEVFGNNAFTVPNLQLVPEPSHNVNLQLTLEHARTPVGELAASATGFFRSIDNLIVLLGFDNNENYANVFGARDYGVEGSLTWTSPGDYVALDGNATYQDLRNDSSGGTFGKDKGSRVPNQPYLFANATARFQLHDLWRAHDELSLRFNSRFVNEFFRTWENEGDKATKQTIPSQLVHTVGLGYLVRGERTTVSTVIEVSNVTDEKVFDFFGLQRPGRAFFWKTTLDF